MNISKFFNFEALTDNELDEIRGIIWTEAQRRASIMVQQCKMTDSEIVIGRTSRINAIKAVKIRLQCTLLEAKTIVDMNFV